MTARLRSWAGWIALCAYLVIGAVLYFWVMPSVAWHWPPDFRLLGYDVVSITPFLETLGGKALDAYVRILSVYDRIFIVSFAVWLALTGWRGSGFRYFVAGLAVVYGVIDLLENAALLRMLRADVVTDALVSGAHHLTMAKFAAAYLCILVLIVHVRRTM